MKLNELYKEYPINKDIRDVAHDFAARKDTEYDWNRFDTLLANMKAKGWKYVDSGFYTHVFMNPNEPYVIKINKRKDDGFAWYAYLTKKISNKHFVKVGNARTITIDGQKVYMFAVEKLKPIPMYLAKTISEFCYTCGTKYLDKKAIQRLIKGTSFYQFDGQQESLAHACEILGTYAGNFMIDTNISNIMQREDKTLVIIDCYADE